MDLGSNLGQRIFEATWGHGSGMQPGPKSNQIALGARGRGNGRPFQDAIPQEATGAKESQNRNVRRNQGNGSFKM